MKELKEKKENISYTQIDAPLQNTNNDRKIHSLMLPFVASEGNTMLKSMNRCIKSIDARITCAGHKLNTRFQINNKTAQIHKYDLVYYAKCTSNSCNQDYLGEAGHIVRLTIELLSRQLTMMVKINIQIYSNMLAMETISILIWTK